jgi:hypothetical protein
MAEEGCNYLELFGDFGPTYKGDQLKGWITDADGSSKLYLNAAECREVARQFIAAAEALEAKKGCG